MPDQARRGSTALASIEPESAAFESLSVVLPVMNETASLVTTVDTLVAGVGTDLGELVIVLSPRSTRESRAAVASLEARFGDGRGGPRLLAFEQRLPFLGGAMRESFERVTGSHVVMMASDLETDPATVPAMVAASKANPRAIITASRWAGSGRGRFQGYDPLKLVLNAAFQRLFKLLYQSSLTDMTYGFRLFPTWLVQAISWEELRHPFLFETIVKPLRLGVQVIEVPTSWRARDEGTSSNTFLANFAYVRTGVRLRRRQPAELLREKVLVA